jgi:3-deoxy-D-manno-octulosonate 8-phosphate phosphatase (KDO 8-P phosphatase)
MVNKIYAEKIKALLFDIDGVLTDGSVVLMPDGQQVRNLFIKDCYALQYAIKKGYHVGIISGGKSEQMRERLQSFGIQNINLGIANKIERFEELLLEWNLEPSHCMYMGDDIPDFLVMQRCGLAACPADAAIEIRQISKFISPFKGGKGAVRDIIEFVLKSQNSWMDQDAYTW